MLRFTRPTRRALFAAKFYSLVKDGSPFFFFGVFFFFLLLFLYAFVISVSGVFTPRKDRPPKFAIDLTARRHSYTYIICMHVHTQYLLVTGASDAVTCTYSTPRDKSGKSIHKKSFAARIDCASGMENVGVHKSPRRMSRRIGENNFFACHAQKKDIVVGRAQRTRKKRVGRYARLPRVSAGENPFYYSVSRAYCSRELFGFFFSDCESVVRLSISPYVY